MDDWTADDPCPRGVDLVPLHGDAGKPPQAEAVDGAEGSVEPDVREHTRTSSIHAFSGVPVHKATPQVQPLAAAARRSPLAARRRSPPPPPSNSLHTGFEPPFTRHRRWLAARTTDGSPYKNHA